MHSGAMVFMYWSQEDKSWTWMNRVGSLALVHGNEWFALTLQEYLGGKMKLMFPNVNITEMEELIDWFNKKEFILALIWSAVIAEEQRVCVT